LYQYCRPAPIPQQWENNEESIDDLEYLFYSIHLWLGDFPRLAMLLLAFYMMEMEWIQYLVLVRYLTPAPSAVRVATCTKIHQALPGDGYVCTGTKTNEPSRIMTIIARILEIIFYCFSQEDETKERNTFGFLLPEYKHTHKFDYSAEI
jgi:hypothetical protein